MSLVKGVCFFFLKIYNRFVLWLTLVHFCHVKGEHVYKFSFNLHFVFDKNKLIVCVHLQL